MKTNVPPIKVWIWVLVAFSLLQLIVIIYYNNIENGNYKDNTFTSQLSDIKKASFSKDTTTYNVVIIGSSLVGNAVACPDEIAGILANYQTKNIVLNKIWKPHDPFQYFVKDKNLINELLLVKPDLICFQTELAAIRYEEMEKYFYSDFEKYVEDLAYKNTSFLEDVFKKQKEDYIKCEDDFIDFEVVEDSLKYVPVKRYIKNNTELLFVLNQLKILKNAGIKIVLVDIPRPQLVEKMMYAAPFMRELTACLRIYQHQIGAAQWKYTGRPMYFKDFYDGGHLNKEGRHLFTQNLLEKIIKEMEIKK
jgi:hypothetical protein